MSCRLLGVETRKCAGVYEWRREGGVGEGCLAGVRLQWVEEAGPCSLSLPPSQMCTCTHVNV